MQKDASQTAAESAERIRGAVRKLSGVFEHHESA